MKIRYYLMFFIVFLASCSTKKEILYLQDIEGKNNTEINFQNPTIQPNDILKITIGALIPETAIPYNKTTSSSQVADIDVMKLEGYLVQSDYKITLPMLGDFSVKDKTTTGIEREIKKLLEDGGHLINPIVNVRILNAKVTVLGEVSQPGTYNFTENGLTFLQALGLAGDLTINGKRTDILLIREINNQRKISHINLTKANWFDTDAYYIKPNDVIVVSPNTPKVKKAGFIGETGTVLTIASLVLSSIILLTR